MGKIMSLDRWKKHVVSSGERIGASVAREGRQRIDPETLAAMQRTARDASTRAVAFAGNHVPDAATVQRTVNGFSQQQMERIVRQTMTGLPMATRAELGRLAQHHIEKTPGLTSPPGLERADPAAVAQVLTQLLQSPQGLGHFAALFGGVTRGGAADWLALGRNPAARQFLGKLLTNSTRHR